MLAAHARILAEEALDVNSDDWWVKFRGNIYKEVEKTSSEGECNLSITEKSELNLEDWINNDFYQRKFIVETKRLGYEIEVIKIHDIVFEIKVKW